jgi:glutathionylspermidine synthase
MTPRSTLIESLATSILDSKGIAAIWLLHLDAAYAYQTGYPVAAEAILELAEAAERVLMRRENAPVNIEQQRRRPLWWGH